MLRFSHRLILKRSLPITCYVLFVLLLSFLFYAEPRALGSLQHIGWQAFDIVSLKPVTPQSPTTPSGPTKGNSTDWWDLEDNNVEPPPTSLPLDIWNPLLSHHTGRTSLRGPIATLSTETLL